MSHSMEYIWKTVPLYIHRSLLFFHTDIYAIIVITNPQQMNKSSAVQSAVLFSACDLSSAVQHFDFVSISTWRDFSTCKYTN